jgi:hypothetical protein
MRYAVFLLILTFLNMAWAIDKEILHCLGKEEKLLHLQKDTGPIYDLNQKIIGELIQIPSIQINSSDLKLICAEEDFSPSWKLLELSITKGKDIFVIANDISGVQKNMTEQMINDYLEAVREIFLGVISQIQSLSPTPDCLSKEIPVLNQFFMEVKYLQEEVDLKTLFSKKDQRILQLLKNYPSAFEKCREDLRKKTKSGSTEEAKKS